MNIGIVVEGDSDTAAYPELIRKIRQDVGTVIPRPCRGKAAVKKDFVSWIKDFEWNGQDFVNKALVIVDSDCDNPGTWQAQLKQIYDQSGFVPSFPVHFYATKCEVETWLLADDEAINQVARDRKKNRVIPPLNVQFETYRNAKELFRRTLSKVGLPVDAKVYRDIAKAANIHRIAARCPYFKQFIAAVQAC